MKPQLVTRLTLGAAALLLAAGSAMPGAATAESYEKYRVLVDRNIFVRSRRRYIPPRRPTSRPAPPPSDSDQDVVLTGIARRGDQYVAFFENVKTGTTIRVSAGERVGKGRAVAITLDKVSYERGEAPREVEIGRNLVGIVKTFAVTVAAPPPPPPTPTPTPAPTASQPVGPTRRGPGPSSQARVAATQPAAAPKPPQAGGTKKKEDDAAMAKILEQMRRRREQELRR